MCVNTHSIYRAEYSSALLIDECMKTRIYKIYSQERKINRVNDIISLCCVVIQIMVESECVHRILNLDPEPGRGQNRPKNRIFRHFSIYGFLDINLAL